MLGIRDNHIRHFWRLDVCGFLFCINTSIFRSRPLLFCGIYYTGGVDIDGSSMGDPSGREGTGRLLEYILSYSVRWMQIRSQRMYILSMFPGGTG